MSGSPFGPASCRPGMWAVRLPNDPAVNRIDACRSSALSAAYQKTSPASLALPQGAISVRTSARTATTREQRNYAPESANPLLRSHQATSGARSAGKKSRSVPSAAARIRRTASTLNAGPVRLSIGTAPRRAPATWRSTATGGTRTVTGDARPTGGSVTESMTSSSRRCSNSRARDAQTQAVIRRCRSAKRMSTMTGRVAPAERLVASASGGFCAPGAMLASVTSRMTRNASVASHSMWKGHEGDRR